MGQRLLPASCGAAGGGRGARQGRILQTFFPYFQFFSVPCDKQVTVGGIRVVLFLVTGYTTECARCPQADVTTDSARHPPISFEVLLNLNHRRHHLDVRAWLSFLQSTLLTVLPAGGCGGGFGAAAGGGSGVYQGRLHQQRGRAGAAAQGYHRQAAGAVW